MRRMNIDEVKKYIEDSSPESKVYIGADSYKYKKQGKWYAEYTIAIVIHLDGNKGCKVFGDWFSLPDYDSKKDKPSIRLMNEVIKAGEMYLELAESIGDREFEIHLDINPDVKHGSNCVAQQAIGYIRGTCNVIPMIKPDAFCASYAADRLREIV